MYIDENNKFDKSLINAWTNECKPYILQQYPISVKNFFNSNSDLHYLVKLIDELKDSYKEKIDKEEKKNEIKKEENNNNSKSIVKDKNNSENLNNTTKTIEEEKKNNNNKNNIIINNNKKEPKIKNQKSKIIEEEDIKILRRKNVPKIAKFIEEFLKENKRSNSMINLRPHSQTIASATTCDDSENNDDTNLNINQIINDNEKKEKNNKRLSNIFLDDIINDTKEKKETELKRTLVRSKTTKFLQGMAPIYREEEENEGKNIKYREPDNKLSFILVDILLKKIIFDNFMDNNVLLIYHFCQQCFCFVEKEILYKKLFNCYKHYKNKNLSLNNLKNLIEFINILVVEMFDYEEKIDFTKCYMKELKKFYFELINDLITNYKEEENKENEKEKDNKTSIDDKNGSKKYFRFESFDLYDNSKNENTINTKNINNFNFILNRKNLIKMNLNTEIKNINIFILKEKKENKINKENIENKENKTKKENKINKEIKENKVNKEIKDNKENKEKENKEKENKGKENEKDKKENKVNKEKENKEKENNGKENEKDIKEKETKKSNEEKDIIKDFKEDKSKNNKNINNYNIPRPDIRNTISFIENKLITNTEEENGDEEKEEINQNDKKIIKEKPKLYQISKTLRNSQIIQYRPRVKDIILEEVDKEDKSDDDDVDEDNNSQKSNKSNISEDKNSDDKPDIEKNEEIKKIEEEKEKEKSDVIDNILDQTFSSDKIVSDKENILNQIQFILYLIDIKNDEMPSFHDIRDAKENIPFYSSVKNLLKKSNKKFMNQEEKKEIKKSFFGYSTISAKPQTINKDFLKKEYFCITDWKTEEIGDKLTQITKSLLNKINPREIYRGVFLKKDKEIKSPNVLNCINKFNKLTSFIIEDVLSYNTPKDRAKIYDKWVQVADYCKNIKNYNDCIAIYSALNSYIITGLKLTFRAMSSKTKNMFEQISNFCACEGNYKNVRDDMNLCEKNGKIFIPYLGMLLRDINFREESSKYINENGCINMDKIENISLLMEKYFRYKTVENKVNTNYKNIKELKFFEELEVIPEEKLEKMAESIEPIFRYGLQCIKRPTKIDQKYFPKYYQQYNNNKKRATITPKMRHSVVPGRAQSYIPSFFN